MVLHPSSEPVEVGSLIHISSDRSKLKTRDKYIVTSVGEDTVDAQKLVGNQFRGRSYNIKRSDIITTAKEPCTVTNDSHSDDSEEPEPQSPVIHSPKSDVQRKRSRNLSTNNNTPKPFQVPSDNCISDAFVIVSVHLHSFLYPHPFKMFHKNIGY